MERARSLTLGNLLINRVNPRTREVPWGFDDKLSETNIRAKEVHFRFVERALQKKVNTGTKSAKYSKNGSSTRIFENQRNCFVAKQSRLFSSLLRK